MLEKPMRTPEFDHYCRTLRCPNGHHGTMRFVEGTGEVLESLQFRDRVMLEMPIAKYAHHLASRRFQVLRNANHRTFGAVSIERFRTDSEIECAACAAKWPVFLGPSFELEEGETRRLHTPLGSDERNVDHTAWTDRSELVLEFEKTWTRRLEIGWEHATVRGVHTTAGISSSVKGVGMNVAVQRRLEESLKTRLSLSSEVHQSSKQSITVSIPLGRIAKIAVSWKQAWEETDCFLNFDTGVRIKVPYRVAVDIIFDATVSHI